jgi:hypothetical protein
MYDPITNKQLAEETIKAFLAQAERDRLALEITGRREGILKRLSRVILNRVPREKAPAREPRVYTPVKTRL